MTGEQPRRERTFAEIQDGPPRKRCRRCGGTATHSIRVSVWLPRESRGANCVAGASGPMCETCAVEVYEAVAKAVRA
jgi:hypothetical protein